MNITTKLKRGLGLSVAGTLALGLGLAPVASADTGHQGDDAFADSDYVYTHEGTQKAGYQVSYSSDSNPELNGRINTNLFNVQSPSDSYIGAYCLEMDVAVLRGSMAKLEEWTAYENSKTSTLAGNVEKQNQVNWIVANSYPEKSLDVVAEASGVESLTAEEAITAAQAAIWTISHEVEFDWKQTSYRPGQEVLTNESRDNIKDLAAYLGGKENTGLDFFGQDRASIDLKAKAHAEASKVEEGYEVGTVQVAMKNMDTVSLHAESLNEQDFTLLAEDGREVKNGDSVKNNDQLTVVVDEKAEKSKELDQTLKFWTDTVEEKSVTGGILQPTLGGNKSQSIVLVGDAKLQGEAELTYQITETPEEPKESETPEEPEVPEQPEEEESPEMIPASDTGDSDDNEVEQPQAQEDSGSLAKTGAEGVWVLGAAGLLLIGGGIGFYLLRRRA